ncbi:MAG: GAF domain-containing protein [Rhodobacteraceae bacterium]|nr:GAF domain-containing protein [Paracoccaceae bacterium]
MDFASEIASGDDQPQRACRGLEALAKAAVGVRLFTLMTVDMNAGEGERIYSNMPRIYPLAGRKPLPEGNWTERVLERRRPFVANSIEAIAEVFPDHEVIRSIGCGSVLNLPIVVSGEVRGTINCLHRTGWYTKGRVRLANDLRLPGMACFLLISQISTYGEIDHE